MRTTMTRMLSLAARDGITIRRAHPLVSSTACLTNTRVRLDMAGEYYVPRINPILDPDGPEITIDGTIKLCEDLQVDPEDVVMLAVAYELKSPRIGQWNKKGWTDGWKTLGSVAMVLISSTAICNCWLSTFLRCDSITGMKVALVRLRDKLGSDPGYFQKVYNHTFDFARTEGQRSLGKHLFLRPQ